MPLRLYDYQCSKGHIHEALEDIDVVSRQCPRCKGIATRIISYGRHYIGNQDTYWLKTVHHVISKDPRKLRGKPATQEFLKNPTRANHRAWMKENKITFMEPGEERERPSVPEISTRALWEEHRKRKAIEVRTR